MPRGNFGSFYGTAKAGEDMVQAIAESTVFPGKVKRSTGFVLRKIAINGEAGTIFKLNGSTVVLPSTGIFETPVGLFDIDSIIFEKDSVVNICYLY